MRRNTRPRDGPKDGPNETDFFVSEHVDPAPSERLPQATGFRSTYCTTCGAPLPVGSHTNCLTCQSRPSGSGMSGSPSIGVSVFGDNEHNPYAGAPSANSISQPVSSHGLQTEPPNTQFEPEHGSTLADIGMQVYGPPTLPEQPPRACLPSASSLKGILWIITLLMTVVVALAITDKTSKTKLDWVAAMLVLTGSWLVSAFPVLYYALDSPKGDRMVTRTDPRCGHFSRMVLFTTLFVAFLSVWSIYLLCGKRCYSSPLLPMGFSAAGGVVGLISIMVAVSPDPVSSSRGLYTQTQNDQL